MKQTCSFCGKVIEEKKNLIKGIQGGICTECLDRCIMMRKTNFLNQDKGEFFNITPKSIKERLDDYIVGQEDAKRILAVEVYNHYKRINLNDRSIEKTNVLLIGSSGSGKTYLVKTLANILDVPLYIADATEYTENGYKGKDVEDIIKGLLDEANNNIENAQNGIIYIDEVDKLATTSEELNRRDVSGKGVQKTLLKLIEGSEINIDGSHIDTSQILFIFGGAFEGLDKIIEKRNTKSKKIGFSIQDTCSESKEECNKYNIEIGDLINYGFMKEFVGRMPLIGELEKLKKEDMIKILTGTKSPLLQQYKKLLALDEISLNFSEDAIEYIAEEACKKDIGARGLKSILSKKMNSLMFDLPGSDKKEFEVTKEYLQM